MVDSSLKMQLQLNSIERGEMGSVIGHDHKKLQNKTVNFLRLFTGTYCFLSIFNFINFA